MHKQCLGMRLHHLCCTIINSIPLRLVMDSEECEYLRDIHSIQAGTYVAGIVQFCSVVYMAGVTVLLVSQDSHIRWPYAEWI